MSWGWRRPGHVTSVVTSDWLVRGKIETQCKDFNGKGKLTVDDLYSVIKLQVRIILLPTDSTLKLFFFIMKIKCNKNGYVMVKEAHFSSPNSGSGYSAPLNIFNIFCLFLADES